jgi:hypothetical protein
VELRSDSRIQAVAFVETLMPMVQPSRRYYSASGAPATVKTDGGEDLVPFRESAFSSHSAAVVWFAALE